MKSRSSHGHHSRSRDYMHIPKMINNTEANLKLHNSLKADVVKLGTTAENDNKLNDRTTKKEFEPSMNHLLFEGHKGPHN